MKRINLFLLSFLFVISSFAQTKSPSQFDFGRMWTFENPPKEWLTEAYGFTPDDAWFEHVRKSSLRFATWCSASFVSADGLIMTNHHCSRDVVGALQKDGENFDTQGFYADDRSNERRAEGLFVEQLIQVAEITSQVRQIASGLGGDPSDPSIRKTALDSIKNIYASNAEWQNLRLQTVTFYSGGRFSLYGYKKYEDIRLVWIPELDLGLYGGDPDNFTYPRYNLDCTFWRAYDENGNALNTSDNYLAFNEKGAEEGEVTFVVGNPGRTERYRTTDQLAWDRDYRYKFQLKFMKNRHKMMMDEYNSMKDDTSKTFEAQELLNNAFSISNGIKAISGILKGLHNEELYGRKVGMENLIKSKSTSPEYWTGLAEGYKTLEPESWAISHLGPSGLRGKVFLLMHRLYKYEKQLESGAASEDLEATKAEVLELSKDLDTPKERKLFAVLLTEINQDIYPGDQMLDNLFEDQTMSEYMSSVFKSDFLKVKKAIKILSKTDKFKKNKDIMIRSARIIGARYEQADMAFGSSSQARRSLESKIANETFNVFGDALPPDATFTLRISDGVVKGYNYNGTEAPYKTTYFGLYDRHYSNDMENPWSLPERWNNPPVEFLQAPINFVSTNDIIGGNSGSPMINKNKECVGLIFDGNIESLPGNFIFDEEYNRTVSVHSGGIVAALKYIYKAEKLVAELVGK